MRGVTQHSEEFHGTCFMTLNLPVSFNTQYFTANNLILDLVIKIGTQKSVLVQLLKIENVNLVQEK